MIFPDRALSLVRMTDSDDTFGLDDDSQLGPSYDGVRSTLAKVPADLGAVIALVVITDVVALAPVLRDTPLRFVFGVVFALFLPGYAVVAALYPARKPPRDPSSTWEDIDGFESAAVTDDDGGPLPAPGPSTAIDGVERVVLSVALSVCIVPLVGYVFNFTQVGIQFVPVLVAVSAITVGLALVGIYRRLSLPAAMRFAVPYRDWITTLKRTLHSPDDRVDNALNVSLILVGVLLVSTLVVAMVATPQQQERYTEVYLAAENETTGELVATDLPTNYTRGEGRSLILGIENHERQQIRYTVVVQMQNVSIGTDPPRIVEERRLLELEARLAHNETALLRHDLAPPTTGDSLRIQYLVYKGPPPAEPTADNAYRELHLWINVTAAG